MNVECGIDQCQDVHDDAGGHEPLALIRDEGGVVPPYAVEQQRQSKGDLEKGELSHTGSQAAVKVRIREAAR